MRKYLFPFLVVLSLFVQACGSSNTPAPSTDIPATNPPVNATPVQGGADTPQVAATETATNSAPVVVSVTHTDIPTDGTSDRLTAHDQDNAFTFENKTARSGDEFFKNEFERPFTANDMNYLPDLDIVNFSITNDSKFYYARISVAALNSSSQTLNGSYGIEIDRNSDGRAELLIVTRPPYTSDFTADNVAVYADLNGDVGGDKVNRPDSYVGDGFETTIYDLQANIYPSGDPDFAWVRQTADGSLPAVDIAFKSWIFDDGKQAFMWNAESSAAVINPSSMYYHDHFTAEQAGAARKDDPNYPVKALAGVDNTCRVPFGFDASGNEPFGCYVSGVDTEVRSSPSADVAACSQFPELCKRSSLQ